MKRAAEKNYGGKEALALVGALRYAEHRSVPENHARLAERGVPLARRSVTNALARYDELVAVQLGDEGHLRRVTATTRTRSPATPSKAYRARTTASSSCSAASATTRGGRAGARSRARRR